LISYTAPTSAIRFLFGFSPRDSRVASFGAARLAAAAVAGAQGVRSHHDPLAIAGDHQHVVRGPPVISRTCPVA
jgi:hypothetical protein